MKVFRFFSVALIVFVALWLVGATMISALLSRMSGGLDDTNSKIYNFVYGSGGMAASVYGRVPLMRNARQVILLGASNTRLGFSAQEVSSALGGTPVHNMGISGGFPKNFKEIVRLSYEAIPEKAWKKTTFVLGLWYGTFVAPAKGEPFYGFDTTKVFKVQARRYGLYRFTEGSYGIAPVLPATLMKPALIGLNPVLLFSRLWDNQTWMASLVADLYLGVPPSASRAEDVFLQNGSQISEKVRREKIRIRKEQGYVTPAKFDDLLKLAAYVQRHGSKLVLVDLPIPKWHAVAVPSFSDYQREKSPYFRELKQKYGVTIIDMQNGFPDSSFFDDVHPKPKTVPVWSKFLAKHLMPVISANTAEDTNTKRR